MILFPDGADEGDRAWITEYIGETDGNVDGDQILLGFIAGCAWIDGEGTHRWKFWDCGNGSSAELVGLGFLIANGTLAKYTTRDETDD